MEQILVKWEKGKEAVIKSHKRTANDDDENGDDDKKVNEIRKKAE